MIIKKTECQCIEVTVYYPFLFFLLTLVGIFNFVFVLRWTECVFVYV